MKILPESIGAVIGGLIAGIGTGDWRIGMIAAGMSIAISASIRYFTHGSLK